jgi:hypothetical protein
MWVCHVARRKARKVVERVVEMRERWVCSVRSKAMVGREGWGYESGKLEGRERVVRCGKFWFVLGFVVEGAFTMVTDNEHKHRSFVTDLQIATRQYCHRTLLE